MKWIILIISVLWYPAQPGWNTLNSEKKKKKMLKMDFSHIKGWVESLSWHQTSRFKLFVIETISMAGCYDSSGLSQSPTKKEIFLYGGRSTQKRAWQSPSQCSRHVSQALIRGRMFINSTGLHSNAQNEVGSVVRRADADRKRRAVRFTSVYVTL